MIAQINLFTGVPEQQEPQPTQPTPDQDAQQHSLFITEDAPLFTGQPTPAQWDDTLPVTVYDYRTKPTNQTKQ